MRTLILLITIGLFLSSETLLCQENKSVKFLLNKQEININYTFLNPDNIESINVDKNLQPNEIQITTKDRKWKYKSLRIFLRTLSNYNEIYNESNIPIFIIDNQFIDRPDFVRIDSSYYGEASLGSLANIEGVPVNCKNLTIVNLKLSKSPIIHIRGTADTIVPNRLKK